MSKIFKIVVFLTSLLMLSLPLANFANDKNVPTNKITNAHNLKDGKFQFKDAFVLGQPIFSELIYITHKGDIVEKLEITSYSLAIETRPNGKAATTTKVTEKTNLIFLKNALQNGGTVKFSNIILKDKSGKTHQIDAYDFEII